jgi:hypothetical protein
MLTARPWRDTDVIDERAPRFNQVVTGAVAATRPLNFGSEGQSPERACDGRPRVAAI